VKLQRGNFHQQKLSKNKIGNLQSCKCCRQCQQVFVGNSVIAFWEDFVKKKKFESYLGNEISALKFRHFGADLPRVSEIHPLTSCDQISSFLK
jgi:hypothetical protein